jgi:glutathione peroxidase
MKFQHALCISISFLVSSTVACGGGQPQAVAPAPEKASSSSNPGASGIIDQTVESLTGETVDLGSFRGHPILIVNTASKCGYTPQYEGLQKLYERYREDGLVVIGFPSNDFGNQEPGTAEEIGNFCRLNYGVSFPMMAKVHTKGPEQAPVYRVLTTESDEKFRGDVRWNFTKFLVDQNGRVVARFDSGVDPLDEQITSAVEALLGANASAGEPPDADSN